MRNTELQKIKISILGIAFFLFLAFGSSESSKTTTDDEYKHYLEDNKTDNTSIASGLNPNDIKIQRVRLVPFTMATGGEAQMVMFKLKNVGSETVKAIYVSIDVYRNGQRLEMSSSHNQCIYSSSVGISPNETYSTKTGEGFVVIPYDGEADRVEASIVKVLDY